MDPIIVEFDVKASPGHAFEVWTEKPSMWWPRSHTVTRDPGLTVVFEPFQGGRIYERGSDGAEHEWGEVLIWDPPERIAYLWHLFFDRNEATEITVTFTEVESRSAGQVDPVRLREAGRRHRHRKAEAYQPRLVGADRALSTGRRNPGRLEARPDSMSDRFRLAVCRARP